MKNMLMFILSFLMMSCGGYNEGVLQKAEKGQLKFVGNILQTTISIDDGKPFAIDKKDVVYSIKPGIHSIKAYKNNQIVLEREVFIDNGITMEIEIP